MNHSMHQEWYFSVCLVLLWSMRVEEGAFRWLVLQCFCWRERTMAQFVRLSEVVG